MHSYIGIYITALFIALTPGIIMTLPKGGSKIKVAITHGLLFAALMYFTYVPVSRILHSMESFQSGGNPAIPLPTGTPPEMPMPGGVPAMPMPAPAAAEATLAIGSPMTALPGGMPTGSGPPMTIARKPESTRTKSPPQNTPM